MRRRSLALLALVLAACPNTPPPQPSMPGQLIGSFAFTGVLVPPEGDADGGSGTTCPLDGGPLIVSPTITFWAYLSQDVEAGVIWWDLNRGSGLVDGGLDGSTFWIAVPSSTPTLGACTSCVDNSCQSCVGTILESIQGWQTPSPEGGFELPVLRLVGRLDDRLAPDPLNPACSADQGLGCGLECDLVYDFVGVPGTAPPQ
jgi:hypothetical protein